MAATTSYETTCPNCGEDFDVRASDAEANCPKCKAHLIFRDLEKERREKEKAKEKARKEKEAAKQRAAEQKAKAAEQAKKVAEAKRKEREEAKLRAAEQKAKAREHAKKVAEAKAAEKAKEAEAKAKAKAAAEAEKRKAAQERAKLKSDERQKSARDTFMTRPERSSGAKGGIPVIDVEGIGPTFEKKLKAVGIHTTDDLLEVDEKKLAEKTGILQKKIRAWQDMCDLMHLSGVGPQYAELLVRSDINSVKELSVQEPKELAKRIKATIDRVNVKITGGGIGPKRAQAMINEARKVYPLDEDPGEKALHEAQETSGPAKLPREPRGEHKGGKSLEQLEKEKEKAAKAKAAKKGKKAADAAKEKEAKERAKLKAAAAEQKAKEAEAKQKAKEEAAKKKAKAKKETAKQKAQAKQDKIDQKDAKKLAISMGMDQEVALQLVKAGVRSVEDLASQNASSLHKKVKEVAQ